LIRLSIVNVWLDSMDGESLASVDVEPPWCAMEIHLRHSIRTASQFHSPQPRAPVGPFDRPRSPTRTVPPHCSADVKAGPPYGIDVVSSSDVTFVPLSPELALCSPFSARSLVATRIRLSAWPLPARWRNVNCQLNRDVVVDAVGRVLYVFATRWSIWRSRAAEAPYIYSCV